ncbi:hypothetical protein ACWGJP_10470 [Microbacterium sp. NPDC055903]
MKTTRLRSRSAGTIVGIAGISLALAACGTADSGTIASSQSAESSTDTAEAETGSVYQFDEARVVNQDEQVPFVSTDADSPIVVQLSEDLSAVVPADRTIAIEQYRVTTEAFTTGICRLDAEVTYASNGLDALATPTPSIDAEPMQNVAASLTRGITADRVEVVDTVPSDDEIEYETVYITSDGSTLTIVDDCSEDPQDTDGSPELQFPHTDVLEGMGYREVLATAYVAVLLGGGQNGGAGTTTVITGEVDADVSPNGTWQTK